MSGSIKCPAYMTPEEFAEHVEQVTENLKTPVMTLVRKMDHLCYQIKCAKEGICFVKDDLLFYTADEADLSAVRKQALENVKRMAKQRLHTAGKLQLRQIKAATTARERKRILSRAIFAKISELIIDEMNLFVTSKATDELTLTDRNATYLAESAGRLHEAIVDYECAHESHHPDLLNAIAAVLANFSSLPNRRACWQQLYNTSTAPHVPVPAARAPIAAARPISPVEIELVELPPRSVEPAAAATRRQDALLMANLDSQLREAITQGVMTLADALAMNDSGDPEASALVRPAAVRPSVSPSSILPWTPPVALRAPDSPTPRCPSSVSGPHGGFFSCDDSELDWLR